jgi:hypothetical protein
MSVTAHKQGHPQTLVHMLAQTQYGPKMCPHRKQIEKSQYFILLFRNLGFGWVVVGSIPWILVWWCWGPWLNLAPSTPPGPPSSTTPLLFCNCLDRFWWQIQISGCYRFWWWDFKTTFIIFGHRPQMGWTTFISVPMNVNSVHPSIHPSVRLSARPSVSLSICAFICPICLSFRLSVRPYIPLPSLLKVLLSPMLPYKWLGRCISIWLYVMRCEVFGPLEVIATSLSSYQPLYWDGA